MKNIELRTAEDALREFRRLVSLEADEPTLSNVFTNLQRTAPDELPKFRELLKTDIDSMNGWLEGRQLEHSRARRN
jgi:hypothetical protein